MALQVKAIKTKIRAVSNIRKITKAMEMVAGAKMRKATSRVLGSKPFVSYAYELLKNLSGKSGERHPLLESPKKAEKTLIISIASNKGLCGGFNTNIRKLILTLRQSKKNRVYVAVGKYMERILLRKGATILASFTALKDSIEERDVWAISQMVLDEYKKGQYKEVIIAYTRFNSAVSYTPITRRILPLKSTTLLETATEMHMTKKELESSNMNNFVFEPNEGEVLDFVIPRTIEVIIYQALLESLASEHSSRMMAMRNASDNAKSFIADLTLGFNQARQANITREIAEISAGALL